MMLSAFGYLTEVYAKICTTVHITACIVARNTSEWRREESEKDKAKANAL